MLDMLDGEAIVDGDDNYVETRKNKDVHTLDRVFFMDSARSILMSLGVVLHTANIYSLDGSWIISDESQHKVFGFVSEFIHAFRMPAFFLISGYFCAMTIKRYGVPRFLQTRGVRIAVPLLCAGVFLNLPQTILTNSLGYTQYDIGSIGFFLDGQWVYHLWFLLNVIFYYLGVSLIYSATTGTNFAFDSPGSFLNNRIFSSGYARCAFFYALFFLLFISIQAMAHVFPALYRQIWFLGSIYGLAYYFLFFLAGLALFVVPNFLADFVSKGWIIWLFAVCLYLVAGVIGDERSIIARTLDSIQFIGLTFALVYSVLALFRAIFDRPSPRWGYLANASYSIYLFHHPIVIAFGIALLSWEAHPGIKFIIVASAAFFFSLAIHELVIRRFRIPSLMFNGK